MRRPPPKKDDPLVLLAKASSRRRRRSLTAALVTSAVFLLLLLGFAWLIWPGPDLPPLALAVYDRIARPGETVSVSAQLEPLEGDPARAGLARCPLYFQEVRSAETKEAATGPDGRASASYQAPDNGSLEVLARYPGDRHRRGVQATGRVFVWPPEAALLVVDADHALADADDTKFWTANNLDVPPAAGASAALRGARPRYAVVYLSAAADRPLRVNKLRAWLEQGWASAREHFPDGPVLGRAAAPGEGDPEAFQRGVLQDLKGRFRGKQLGVAKDAAAARLFQQAGLTTFVVGAPGEVPEGVTAVKTWAELAPKLAE